MAKDTIRKTRIKCSTTRVFHTIEIHANGVVLSSGCGNITQEVERITGMLRLGRTPPAAAIGSCAYLAALVLHGCEIIINRPADEEGFIADLGGWREVYIRFEENKLVKAQMKRVRAANRRKRKAAERKVQPVPPLLGTKRLCPLLLSSAHDPTSCPHCAQEIAS